MKKSLLTLHVLLLTGIVWPQRLSRVDICVDGGTQKFKASEVGFDVDQNLIEDNFYLEFYNEYNEVIFFQHSNSKVPAMIDPDAWYQRELVFMITQASFVDQAAMLNRASSLKVYHGKNRNRGSLVFEVPPQNHFSYFPMPAGEMNEVCLQPTFNGFKAKIKMLSGSLDELLNQKRTLSNADFQFNHQAADQELRRGFMDLQMLVEEKKYSDVYLEAIGYRALERKYKKDYLNPGVVVEKGNSKQEDADRELLEGLTKPMPKGPKEEKEESFHEIDKEPINTTVLRQDMEDVKGGFQFLLDKKLVLPESFFIESYTTQELGLLWKYFEINSQINQVNNSYSISTDFEKLSRKMQRYHQTPYCDCPDFQMPENEWSIVQFNQPSNPSGLQNFIIVLTISIEYLISEQKKLSAKEYRNKHHNAVHAMEDHVNKVSKVMNQPPYKDDPIQQQKLGYESLMALYGKYKLGKNEDNRY